jgi:hypothetical protein
MEDRAILTRDIPISGFRTVPTGPVNMKLGVMATEGDVGSMVII